MSPSKPKGSSLAAIEQTDLDAIEELVRPRLARKRSSQRRSDRNWRIARVPLAEIKSDSPIQNRRPFDPAANEDDRQFLESVKQHGILVPPGIVLLDGGEGDRRVYRCVKGHRRLAAARLAGLTQVNVILYAEDVAEESLDTITLVENAHRTDLSPLEQAAAIQRYMDRHSQTASGVARLLQISNAQVSILLSLLEAPEEVRELLRDQKIGARNAYELTKLTDNQRAKVVGSLKDGHNFRTSLKRAGGGNRQAEGPSRRDPGITSPPGQGVIQGILRSTLKGEQKRFTRAIQEHGKGFEDPLSQLLLVFLADLEAPDWELTCRLYQDLSGPIRSELRKVLRSLSVLREYTGDCDPANAQLASDVVERAHGVVFPREENL
jgi:ParB/RepB/Spo0J family partition protein